MRITSSTRAAFDSIETAGELDDGRPHALRHETLQLGMDGTVLGGEDIPARLHLLRDALNLLVEQVRRRRRLGLFLRPVEVSDKVIDGLIGRGYLQPDRRGDAWTRPKRSKPSWRTFSKGGNQCHRTRSDERFVQSGSDHRGSPTNPSRSAVSLSRASGGSGPF